MSDGWAAAVAGVALAALLAVATWRIIDNLNP